MQKKKKPRKKSSLRSNTQSYGAWKYLRQVRVGKMPVNLLGKNPVHTGDDMYLYSMRHVHIHVTCLNVSCNDAQMITFFANG